MKNEICTVVVTYNRKELLKENIQALLSQTYKNFDILIIDNGSTDGTKDYINQFINNNVYYYNTNKNLGGAGGFSYGIKKALEANYKYTWIMDDDTIPIESALESLVNKKEILNNNFSYLCSLVKFTDGNLCKMNIPKINTKWLYYYESIERGLISIQTCSFVSCFINLDYAKKVGLPIKEFFIYGDDVEYTKRLSKCKEAFIDINSIVYHKMKANTNTDIVYVEKERIDRSYYTYRNRFYIAKQEGKKEVFKYLLKYLYVKTKILFKSKDKKIKRLWIITRGFWTGIFFNPKIEKTEEKNGK